MNAADKGIVVGDRVSAVINAEVVAISLDEEWLQVRFADHTFWISVDEFVERISTPQELEAQRADGAEEPYCKIVVDGKECGKPATARLGVPIVGGEFTIPVCEAHSPGIITSITGSKLGFGRCYRCNRTWQNCRSHSTQFSREEGCFALCEECWQVLDVEGRLVYYRQLWQDWSAEGNSSREEWEQIELAVRQGK